jgi:hypothetical protein
VVVSIPAEMTLSVAAIHAALHSIRISANAGIVSPADVDKTLDGILETLENLPPEFLTTVQRSLDPLFVEIKHAASSKWSKE